MRIEVLTIGDITCLDGLQPEGWLPIVPYYEFYVRSKFCSPVKCTAARKIVGIGAAIVHEKTGWLAHIIVDEAFRRQGVGTAITRRLMELLRGFGVGSMLLVSTPVGEGLYRNLGFQKESEYVFLKGGITPLPDRATIAFEPEFRKTGLELDFLATQEQRSELLEPHWGNACCIVSGNRMEGFFMPTLGEGYILSETVDAGLELLRKKHCDGRFGVIPLANQGAIRYLHESGFEEYRRGIRMVHGKALDWHPEMIYGRVGGNLG